MKFIQGHNRNQIILFPVSLDQSIDPDNEVRMIDLFVDSLSIKDYGFRTDYVENGRPAYHPTDLLKLFIYIELCFSNGSTFTSHTKTYPTFKACKRAASKLLNSLLLLNDLI